MARRTHPLAAALLALAVATAAPLAMGHSATAPVMSLTEAYRLALANDAGAQAARWAVVSAQERLQQSEAQLQPNVSLGVSRFYNDLDRTQPNFLGQQTTVKDRYYSYNQTLQLRQPLYRPVLARGVDVARAQVADVQGQAERELQNVGTRVVDAYLLALQAQQARQLLQRLLANAQRQVEAAQQRLQAGLGVRTDVDELLARIDALKAQMLEAEQTRETALLQLKLLTQTEVQAVADLEPEALKPEAYVSAPLLQWLQRAKDASPELKALQARLEAARQEVRRTEANHLPTLDAVLQLSRSGSENVTSPSSAYVNRQVGLQLNVPLYAGGAVQSAVRQALAEEQRVQAVLEATERDLQLRVQREWRAAGESAKRYQALMQAVASAEVALDSVQKSFQAGVRTVQDVLAAQDRLAQAHKDRMDAALAHAGARLRLLALTGELDEAQMAQAQGWFRP